MTSPPPAATAALDLIDEVCSRMSIWRKSKLMAMVAFSSLKALSFARARTLSREHAASSSAKAMMAGPAVLQEFRRAHFA